MVSADAEESGHAGEAEHGAHGAIHLPPPSFVPVVVALALALVFVGLLKEVRDTVGPAMWLIGLLMLIASCAWWGVTARREYVSLPEDQQH